jgi:peptidoglycan/xylan/chitin deacetylase (PgdA/CDA1 family)
MRLISPLLKHAIYPGLHRIGWLDRFMPPCGYAVVNYHGLVPTDHANPEAFLDGNLVRPEAFRQQLQYLKAHYHVIHPEDFRTWVEQGKPLPSRAVLVTCDDGLVNTLTDMVPILQSETVSCLFFVTGASCRNDPGMLWYEELYQLMRVRPSKGHDLQLPLEEGAQSHPGESFQGAWWNTVRRASLLPANARAEWIDHVRSQCEQTQTWPSAGRSERRWRLLNIAELKRLSDAGMSIGAHTLSHPVLSLCSEEEARREIQESKCDLERALGKTVWAFAYPFGDPSTIGQREVRLAREAGYTCAFLNVEHWDVTPANVFALPRIHVCSNTTVPELAAHLSGLHNRIQRAVRG